MRQRKLRTVLLGTAALFASRAAMACPRDGTPGPCHCAERMSQMLASMGMSTAITGPDSAALATPAVDPSGGTTTVHIINDDFSINPAGMPVVDATIQVGGTIHWVLDAGFHNVNSVVGSSDTFLSGDMFMIGQTFDHQFRHDGVYVYYCDIHGFDQGNGTAGGMAGTITVVTPTWNVDGSGDWNSSGNWSGGVPNSIDGAAMLGSKISSSQTVSANAPITVGSLKFDNSNTYQISGSGSLTLAVSTGVASLNVAQGSHQINVPLIFASDSNVNIASGGALAIGGATTINANKTVTKTGNVTMQGSLTIQSGGVLQVQTGSTALRGAPSLAAGAKIDVGSNAMTVDYQGLGSAASAIAAQLTGGYNGGAWNGSGINTSAAIANQTGLGWKDDQTAQSILVKYALYGDADLSGTVDSVDFNILAANFSQSGRVWSQADFNYSGTTDSIDFNLLASNFSKAVPSSSVGALVPEPAGLVPIALFAMTWRFRRRRPLSPALWI